VIRRLRKRNGTQRRGAAAVEMAAVTPFLMLMLLGIIEFGWLFTVRQGLVTAAREGARVAALPGSTPADVEDRVRLYLNPLGLTSFLFELTRATPDNGNAETVRVAVPYAQVTLIGGFFTNTDFNLEATCSMRKEALD